jgi:hypothetical protein
MWDRAAMRRITILALLAVLVAGVAGVLLLRPSPRFTLGVLAVGPGEALLVTRHNETHGTRGWIEHVDAGGALRWSAEVTPLEVHEALGFSSVAATGELIVALARGPDGDVVLALDRVSGARQWSTTLPAIPRSGTPIGPTVLLDGPRVVLVRETAADGTVGAVIRLDAVALADGAHLWHHEPGDDGDVLLIAPDRLLVTTRDRSSVLDGAGQVVASPSVWRVMCPLPTGVLASGGRQLVVLSSAPARELPLAPEQRITTGPCGDRDGDLVVTTQTGDLGGPAIGRLASDTGVARWPATPFADRLFEPVVAIEGRLPRFLPFTLYGRDADGPLLREFAVLDLDTGTVVARGPLDETADAIVSAGRGWLSLRFRGVIVGFDPATGAYASATRLTGLRFDDARVEDVRFGELWLYGVEAARPDALPWAHVDLASGAVTHIHGAVGSSDATAEFRAVFAR